jgi:hypothetical protein
MSQKVIQLDMFRTEKEEFEEVVVKSFKSLFARDGMRQKENKELYNRTRELEEIVLRMNDRLNRLTQ